MAAVDPPPISPTAPPPRPDFPSHSAPATFPPLTTQAASAARAAARVIFATIGHNPVFVPPGEREARYLTCSNCDKFYAPTTRCRQCGCTLKVKLNLRTESCPLGYWS